MPERSTAMITETDRPATNPASSSLAEEAVAGVAPDAPPAPSAEQIARALVDGPWLAELIDSAAVGDAGLRLTGEGGFLPAFIKAVLERGLQVELADHLGYDKGDPAGREFANSRNGTTSKTVQTEVGAVALDRPRDRQSSFEPRLVPKGARRLAGGLDEMIISLFAGGMTVRDIEHHLQRTLGVELSRETISNITDAVAEEVKAWQTRPLDPVYPIVYIDALVVKVRDGGHVVNKAAHIVVGVDTDGIRHVLGIWVQSAEGAKFWLHVLTELRNRGVTDVLIACCDGLEGLPEAIETVWPNTVTQTCVVHLIRACMRYLSYNDRKAAAALLKPIYTAANEQAALDALAAFADSNIGKRYPAAVAVWERAWERFTPFLAFPPEVRRIIYTTNDRVAELPAAQDHQEPRALPQRRSGDQAALAGHPRHRRQARPRTRQGEGSPRQQTQGAQSARRGSHRPGLETSPQRTHHRLPRPATGLRQLRNLETATYTEHLTTSRTS
jgi:putative transposase